MKLYLSKTSPFARKVRMAAQSLGLLKEIEMISTDVYQNTEAYKKINPLIKIPALETRQGEILTNSPFICQYLASLKSGTLFFPQGEDLWKALNIQSIADGGMEAAVLRRYETMRSPDKFDASFDNRQKEKIHNALEYLQNHLMHFSKSELGIQEVSVICFVDYLHLRYSHEKLQNFYPRIFEYVDQWHNHPIVKESSPL
jgi:glutathione S-transferase